MRVPIRAPLLVLAMILAAGLAPTGNPPSASSPAGPPENFARVDDRVFRSGQPDRKQLEFLVNNHDIKSLLTLRQNHDDESEARGLPLRLYRIPMRAGNIRRSQMIEALAVLRDAPKPILIHCWHGSDRTGFIVALYRMVFQSWARERVIDEFKEVRFGHHEEVYPNLERALRTVDVEKLKAEVLPKNAP